MTSGNGSPLPEAAADLVEYLALMEGFGLFIATVPNGRVGRTLREQLEQALAPRLGFTPAVIVQDPYGEGPDAVGVVSRERLLQRVGEPLVQGRFNGPEGAIVLVDGSRSTPHDAREWVQLFYWLNRARDRIASALHRPLLLVLTPDLYAEFARSAPDFWSIRRDVAPLSVDPPWEALLRELPPLPDSALPRERRALFEEVRDALARQDGPALIQLEHELAELQEPAVRRVSVGDAAAQRLALLLHFLFPSTEALRRTLRDVFGANFVERLPGSQSSASQLVHETVRLLVATGNQSAMLEELLIRYPMRQGEILAVREAMYAPTDAALSAYAALWHSEILLRRRDFDGALSQLNHARREATHSPARYREHMRIHTIIDDRLARVRALGVQLARHGAPISYGLTALGADRSDEDTRELSGLIRELQSHERLITTPEGDSEAEPDALVSPEPPLVVLANYNPDEVLPGFAHALRLYAPINTEDRSTWEQTFGAPLLRFRSSLRDRNVGEVHILPRCALSVAVRAGLIFHERSGVDVGCYQLNEQHGRMELWTLQGAASDVPPATVREDAKAQEIHLLFSVTHDLRVQWDEWQFRHGVLATRVHLALEEAPSRGAITDVGQVLGLAARARAALDGLDPRLPLRIAIAGPAVLAVAVGRALTARRRIHLMDYDLPSGRYLASFHCVGGA